MVADAASLQTTKGARTAAVPDGSGRDFNEVPPVWRRVRWLLLALVLAVHIVTRVAAAYAIPLEQRGVALYTQAYRVSLSYVAGHGWEQFAIGAAPSAVPVREFLEHRRGRLSRAELEAAFRDGLHPLSNNALPRGVDAQGRPADVSVGILTLPNVRALDVRVVAILWRIFGIRWSVIYGSAVLASTVTCLGIFLLGRQAGGWGAGIAAAILFTASPIEGEFVMRALRDINPLWFATLGFWATFCVAGRGRGLGWNLASCAAAGAASTVGLGWRPDLLALAPFLAVFLVIRFLAERRGLRATGVLGLAFVLGAAATFQGIRWLAPFPQVVHQAAFHNAYYGHAVRANLFSIEDTFQTFRCDILTAQQAAQDSLAQGVDPLSEPVYSTNYNARCRSMYLTALRDRAAAFVVGFPKFCWQAVHGPAFANLPVNHDVDGAAYRPPTRWPAFMVPIRAYLFRPLNRAAPALVLIGLLAVLLLVRPTALAAAIACYVPYYCVVLLLVLPEYKHTGQLVLPMALLGGLGLAGVRLGLAQRFRAIPLRISRARWMWSSVIVASVLLVWGVGWAVAYPYGLQRRAELLAEIRVATREGVDEPADLLSPQVFSVRRTTDMPTVSEGYLLDIEAGPEPGVLECRHLRLAPPARCYVSRHLLQGGRRQYFFVTIAHPGVGDVRPYVCTVVASPGAQILACRRVALRHWRDLPVSTVFDDGPVRSPVPPAADFSNRTYYENIPFDEQGLTSEDRRIYGISQPSHGVPAR